MLGLVGGKSLLGGPIENLYDFVRSAGPAPEPRIDVLTITLTTAVVPIDMEKDAAGACCNDCLFLIKLDGRWRAVSKWFHQLNC